MLKKMFFLCFTSIYILSQGCTSGDETKHFSLYFNKYFEGSTFPDYYIIIEVIDSLQSKQRVIEYYTCSRDSLSNEVIFRVEKYKLCKNKVLYKNDYQGFGYLSHFKTGVCDTIKLLNQRGSIFGHQTNCYLGKRIIDVPPQKNMIVHEIQTTIDTEFGLSKERVYYDENMNLVKLESKNIIHSRTYNIVRVRDIPQFVKNNVSKFKTRTF